MTIILLGIYLTLFTLCAINPADRATWWAENIPIVGIVILIVFLYLRGVRFSNTAYLMMMPLLLLHTIGGHYTFERVPFGVELFNSGRNDFDRVAHFTVGFFAYPLIEWCFRTKAITHRGVLYLFPIFFIAFIAMSYELIEWQYAVQYGGESAANFLGSQGDPWDAQKDMLADTLGAIVAVIGWAVGQRPSSRVAQLS